RDTQSAAARPGDARRAIKLLQVLVGKPRHSDRRGHFPHVLECQRIFGHRVLLQALRFWFLTGSVRMRFPVAANIALSTAGAATKIVGSPTPPQNPPDGITIVSTLGMSRMRM